MAVLGGVEQKVRYFVMSLPKSEAMVVKAHYAKTAEAYCDGHMEAFAFFGGVPLSILYDNTVRRQSYSESLGRFVTEAQVRFLFEFRRPRPGAATGVAGLSAF